MKKVPDDLIINLAFRNSIDREEMLLRKYDDYFSTAKSEEMRDMLREFKKYSQDHIKMVKDKVMNFHMKD